MDCHLAVMSNGRWLKTPVRALWDTGTSITVITPEVASKLPLTKFDREIVLNGMDSQRRSDLYFASVFFPNGKIFGPILVAVQEIPTVDILLGMNVILGGKFSIERKPDGGTRFTFDMNL